MQFFHECMGNKIEKNHEQNIGANKTTFMYAGTLTRRSTRWFLETNQETLKIAIFGYTR